uniref:Uncharacterized protein n=1 Tax=Romanomermis culicivorax TaxID=13658 RepID=A0A915HXL9_ROMCU
MRQSRTGVKVRRAPLSEIGAAKRYFKQYANVIYDSPFFKNDCGSDPMKKKKVKRLVIVGEVVYFECVSCNSHGNPMGRAAVHESNGQSNPDHGHNTLCVPLTLSEVEAKSI